MAGLGSDPALAQPAPAGWKLAMAGDIMLGNDHPQPSLPPNQGRGLLAAATPSLTWADVAIGNLEGTLAHGGTSSKQGCAKCYAFRTPPAFASRLAEAGFDLMSLANNHARDFGDDGLRQTVQALAHVGVAGTGWAGSGPASIERHGQRLCLLAFAPNRGMNDIRDVGGAARQVQSARQYCHLVVVSFHGGAEGSDKVRTPLGEETYLGENRGNVRRFSRAMIDAGAHVVFGHGPHVPRGMELYKGHLIAYSLGNFMTYGGMNVSGVLGYAPLLLVNLDAHGRLINGRIDSYIQSPRQPLASDPQMRAARAIIQLTEADFGGGGLGFDTHGGFAPRPKPTTP